LLSETNTAAAKRGPAPKQQKQMERISRFLIVICFLQHIKQSALSAKMHGANGSPPYWRENFGESGTFAN
jgi:hypothetical protein